MLDWFRQSSFHRKAIVVVAGVSILSGIAGTAAALTLTSLDTQQISLFDSQTADSNFNIQSYDTKVKGKEKVDVDLTLKNTDTNASHRANVTVELLDASGTTLDNATKATGSVAADDTIDMTFSFQQSGLAEDYEETFIVVDDSS